MRLALTTTVLWVVSKKKKVVNAVLCYAERARVPRHAADGARVPGPARAADARVRGHQQPGAPGRLPAPHAPAALLAHGAPAAVSTAGLSLLL